MSSTPQTPIVNAGNRYVNGLTLANFSTTVLAIAPGIARDLSNTNDIVMNSAAHVSTLSVGLNALDTGTIAPNLYYAVYVIADSTSYHPTGFILSLNTINPILPLGYDMYRRIGWIRTDGSSHILPFIATGNGISRKYTYLTPLAVVTGGTATTFTAGTVNLTSLALVPSLQLYIPFGDLDTTTGIMELTLNSVYTAAGATNDLEFAALAGSTVGIVAIKAGVAAEQEFQSTLPVLTGGSGTNMFYRVVAGDSVDIKLASYTDTIF